MSPTAKWMFLILVLPLKLLAGVTEWYSVVEIKDNFKAASFAVVTNEEYTKLTKEVWVRNRVLTQAIRLTRDEWTKSEETKDKVYPVAITCKAEVKRIKTFPEIEKAKTHAALLSEELAAKEDGKRPTTYIEKRIKILEDELENQPKAFSEADVGSWVSSRKNELDLMLKEYAERQEKDRVVKEMEDKAKSLISSYIEALVVETDRVPSSTITLI